MRMILDISDFWNQMSSTAIELNFISEFNIMRDDVMFMAVDAIFQAPHKMSYEEFEQTTDDIIMNTLLDDFLTVDGQYLLPSPESIISPKYMMNNVRDIVQKTIYKMYLCVYDQVLFYLTSIGMITNPEMLTQIHMPRLRGVYTEAAGVMIHTDLIWSDDRYDPQTTQFETKRVI